MNELNLWKKASSYEFSEKFKQKDIVLLSKTLAKSTSSDSYKFAILEPNLETNSMKKFSFKMSKIVSTWVAVGICHRDIVVSNDYRFKFGSTGHGAYMISSNGGVWSNKRS